MSVVKVHRLAVVGDNQAELEEGSAAARHTLTLPRLELWRSDEGGDYFVVTRWADEVSAMRTWRLSRA